MITICLLFEFTAFRFVPPSLSFPRMSSCLATSSILKKETKCRPT